MEVVWRKIDVIAEGVEKMNGTEGDGERWSPEAQRERGESGEGKTADRTSETDGWKRKATRQEGRSRSRLIRERYTSLVRAGTI